MEQKTLIVAEKPSVARDIARVLGVKGKADGYIDGEQYAVTWALGHLVTLCEPDELNPEYKKWRMDQLPILPDDIPTKVLPKTKSQFSVVKKLMNSKEIGRIICATDSGREGELIFRLIYEKAGCKKPFDRLWISSMTDAAIREGFARLLPGSEYDALYMSAKCRSISDWLVGMNASRAFTLRYNALLSIGRVQTPTLQLIVKRDREIAAFVPKDYYEIRADFIKYEGLWLDPETNETRCLDKSMADKIKKETVGGTGTVIESRREMKKTPPPQLFDLTSLQREANKKLGFSAKKTLELAQALYEQRKLITYPRTDSRYLPRDMIGKVRSTLAALPPPYKAFVDQLEASFPVTGRMYNDAKVSDHHAIVPTGHKADLDKLPPDERHLFDMVARRFVAAHYPDYEYESAQVLTKVGAHTYKTSGATPVKSGWRALYEGEKDEEEQSAVPRVEVGETYPVKGVSVKAQKTKPPAALTDASLLYLMESAGRALEDEALRETMKDSGLGTPATRAAIIERLIQVGYASRKGKAILSTEKGQRLIDAAPEEIASPETTGKWEKALKDMAAVRDPQAIGKQSERFMQGIRNFTIFLVDYAKAKAPDVQFDREERTAKTRSGKRKVVSAPKSAGIKFPCPLCGQGEVTENAKAFGCSRWKEGCKFTVWKNALTRSGGGEIPRAAMESLLKTGRAEIGGKAVVMEKGAVKIAD